VLDEAVADQRSFIDSAPRLRGAVQTEDGRIFLRTSYEGHAPGIVVCRFRPRSDTPARLYEYASPGEGNVFSVSASGYYDRSFWYQIGWQALGASQPIWEPWVETIKDR
jgi:hypothetical protein